jgi:triphosphoribosyl-dephospho-CoA synthetase
MANLLLSDHKADSKVSDRWVGRFIERHDELRSKYNRKYDYQRAQCEEPEIIKNWFNLVQNTIAKYGILEQDMSTTLMKLAFRWVWHLPQRLLLD